MFAVGTPLPPTNTYKNGLIGQGFGTLMQLSNQDIVKRRFVPGEKFWLTRVEVQNDCIAFELFSDPYDDIRYTGSLKIMFPEKKTVPSVDAAMQLVTSVLEVQGSSGQAARRYLCRHRLPRRSQRLRRRRRPPMNRRLLRRRFRSGRQRTL